MNARVFMKRLAGVEIDPERSNQHEFNAGRLRRELDLRGDPCQGAVQFLFYKADDAEPVIVTETYTLYDARRRHPSRTEWRMYYPNRGVARHARAGDLMLLFRLDVEATDLIAVVARRGTTVERALTRLLAGIDPEELVDPRFVDSKVIDQETRRLLLRVHRRPAVRADINTYECASHPLFQRAATEGHMPTTTEMANAAQGIVADMGITEGQPDEFVDMALKAETALFFAIEEMLGNKKLSELAWQDDLYLPAVMRLCMSYQQSRKSRRGRSLENHFRTLMERLRIPHGYQCTTEPGKKPDFVFPNCEAYHDPTFPDDRLHMVGCKTRVRERHTQWLAEAARIPLKFALCVDAGLTDALVSGYEGRLRFFMPAQLLDSTYAKRAIRPLLGSVSDLIAALRTATAES